MSTEDRLIVRQQRGVAGRPWTQRLVLKGLGLRGPGSEVVVANERAIRGMIRKVLHLVTVDAVSATAGTAGGGTEKGGAAKAGSAKAAAPKASAAKQSSEKEASAKEPSEKNVRAKKPAAASGAAKKVKS